MDQSGRVLAHPKQEWIAERRDISSVAPVQSMMRGETGVTRFFSPAAQKEMVSGYTVVPQTGWGVMVPQPVSELEAQARDVQTMAMVVLFGGVVAATLIAWAPDEVKTLTHELNRTAEQIDTALTPFGQVEETFNRSHRGVGLGLPLAKRLMEVHGGRLEVESKPGEGTIVSVHFPPERVVQVSI